MTCLLNRLSFITAISGLGPLLAVWQLDAHSVYIWINLFVILCYSTLFLLNVFNKPFWGKLHISIIVPLWFNMATIALGGTLAQSMVAGATIMIAYVAFRRHPKLRFGVIIYNIVFHVAVVVYAALYQPYFGYFDFPMDEGFIFLVALIWGFAVFKLYDNEKEELIESLRKKNAELEVTKEELERFTYIASHDLKSPLRTIISFSDLMEIHLKKERYDDLKDDIGFVKSGAKQMSYLINDILEFSQITGKKELEKKRLNLNVVLKKAESNLRQEIQEKRAKILAQDLPDYCGNETEFILLFQNIIQNGIKYNTSNLPTIQIWANQSPTSISINIKDNGIGIDSVYHDKIFQYFKRLHTTEKYQGTGLGLGLCQKLIRKYEGIISVESTPEEGSTFTIELPIIEKQVEPISKSEDLDLATIE